MHGELQPSWWADFSRSRPSKPSPKTPASRAVPDPEPSGRHESPRPPSLPHPCDSSSRLREDAPCPAIFALRRPAALSASPSASFPAPPPPLSGLRSPISAWWPQPEVRWAPEVGSGRGGACRSASYPHTAGRSALVAHLLPAT